MYMYFKCGKFRGSCAIVSLVGFVPSCHGAFVGISWIQSFSRGYFLGPKFFLVDISWVQIFFRRYFVGPKFFSWVFVSPKFFLVSISRGQIFFSCAFFGLEIFSCVYLVGLIFFLEIDFVIQRFSVAGCMSKSNKNRNNRNTSQTAYSFLNRF